MSNPAETTLGTPSAEGQRFLKLVKTVGTPLRVVAPGDLISGYLGVAMMRSLARLMVRHEVESTPVATTHGSRPVRGEWVGGAPATPGAPILYYLHGSGYVSCSPATHRPLVARLARRTGRTAFSLDYRIAPRYQFPSAHDDTLNGYLWLLAQGHRPGDIVVAGDSAGGHLALALCGELRRRGLAQPAGLVLFSPLVDATFEAATQARRRTADPTVHPGIARAMIRLYTKSGEADDPRLDVIQEVGPDLPPILVQAGAREMMSADAELLAEAQTAAGGVCELQVWPGMIHVFQIMSFLPESGAALDQAAAFVSSLEGNARQAG